MAYYNVIYILICVNIFVAISYGQKFVMQPANKEVIIGGNVTLSCGVTNFTSDHLFVWNRGLVPIVNNGTILDFNTATYNIDITENNGVVTQSLHILNISTNNHGTFFGCEIIRGPSIIGESLATSDYASIAVHYAPAEKYPICDPGGSFNVTVGSQVIVTCISEPGSPSIDLAWMTPLGNTLISYRTVLGNGNFEERYTFVATKTDNGKVLNCLSGSFSGIFRYRETCMAGPLNVLYPPDDISLTLTTHNGFSAFRCAANSNPLSLFNWSFNTQISSTLYEILDAGQLLVLRDSIPCHTIDVIATCTSKNSQGTFSVNTTLCKVPKCRPPDHMFNLTEYDNLTLSCDIDNLVDCMTLTRIYIVTDAEEELATLQATATLDQSLTVHRTHASTLYQCSAANKIPPWIGKCHSGPLANIYFPPNDISIVLSTYNQQSAFRCSATGYPGDISYTWIIMPAIDAQLYSIIENGQLLVLHDVIMCSETDIFAHCQASNTVGTYNADTVLCQVPTCLPPDIKFNKTEGDQVHFSCQIEGQIDSLNWTSINLETNSSEILNATKTQKMLTYDLSVTRKHAQTLFFCSAFSEAPPWLGLCESGLINSVLFPPNDIAISQINYANYTAFQCSATAFPMATFNWTISGALDPSQYIIREPDHSLVILDTILCDSSDIVATCTVQNSLDMHFDMVTLCKVPICTPPGTFEHLEGERASLLCQSSDQAEDIVWIRKSSSNITQLGHHIDNQALTYSWEVDRGHSQSSYECHVANTAPPWIGKCHSGPLNVFFPPNDVSIESKIIVQNGSHFESYICTATGNPSDIEYIWDIVPSLDAKLYDISGNNRQLTIKGDIECNTDITASCVASNSIATHRADITLCKAPTCIPSTLPAITEGENKTFLCQHDVSPVKISWFQNGSSVTVINSTLFSYHHFTAARENTNTTFTCTTTNDMQPSYKGYCSIGPLIVQYPPEHVAIHNSTFTHENETVQSFICSANGYPEVTYTWNFNNNYITQGLDYIISDGGRELLMIDLDACKEDIMATCVASNTVGKESITMTVCKVPPSTSKPIVNDDIDAEQKSGKFELTSPWIIVITLCVFMLLVILVALVLFAVTHNPLISVDLEDNETVTNKDAKAIRLSLAPSEHSLQDIKQLDDLKPVSLAMHGDPILGYEDPGEAYSPTELVPIAEWQEDGPKEAYIVGYDNQGFTSFKGDEEGTVAEIKRPDLLDYMARPDNIGVDITMGNVDAQESKMPNGSAANTPAVVHVEATDIDEKETKLSERSKQDCEICELEISI